MPASSKEFLDIQATIECGFTLKCMYNMIRSYSQIHHTDKYSQHSSIIWPVLLNGWVFVYELSGWGFKSSYSKSLRPIMLNAVLHLKLIYLNRHYLFENEIYHLDKIYFYFCYFMQHNIKKQHNQVLAKPYGNCCQSLFSL